LFSPDWICRFDAGCPGKVQVLYQCGDTHLSTVRAFQLLRLTTPSRSSDKSLRLSAQEITTPEKFFGFQLGAYKKMARWDKIVEYYAVLEKQSAGRMKVVNMAPLPWATRF
jgi:hypothetical protein